jgi:hypothetical protein
MKIAHWGNRYAATMNYEPTFMCRGANLTSAFFLVENSETHEKASGLILQKGQEGRHG